MNSTEQLYRAKKAFSRQEFLRLSVAGAAGVALVGGRTPALARSGATLHSPAGFDGAAWIRRGISGGDTARDPDEYTFARKEVVLDPSKVGVARARVSASHKYELWINGTRADKGQSFNYPSHQYYQETDVTDFLRAGKANAIGVLYHWYGPGQGRPEAEPGAIVRVVVEHENGATGRIVTDGSWRVYRGPWESAPLRNGDVRDYVEIVDGRASSPGWSEPGFDDSGWEPALALGAHPTEPWERLISQESRIVEKPARPVSLTRLDSGAYVADFGRVVAAVPVVRFRRGKAGRRIQMRAGYRLEKDGQVSTDPMTTQDTDMSYEYIQRDGGQDFRAFTYLGFRYLQIENPAEELNASSVSVKTHYNRVPDERAATFSSSNETLDAVWELARHSALHGSQEQFVDTPTREKGQFLGDAFNISLTAMRAFKERALTRQSLREFARSQERYWPDGRLNAVYPNGDGKRDIPDYTEIFPEWAWRYYRETGDRALLEELYPVTRNVADYVARHIDENTGLVTNLAGGGGPYLYGIVDWPAEMRYGHDMDTAARTTVNVLGLSVFRRVGQIAEEIGRPPEEIRVQRGREGDLETAINEKLLRSDGIYVDGLKADGTRSNRASQHANAYPLAFGIVPAEHLAAVGDHVVAQKMAMGPMTAYWLLRALDKADRHSEMIDLITDPSRDGWARILADDGTFTWESWLGSKAGHSESHPWGATVLVNMQEALLGVTLTEPGAAAISIRPQAGKLDWLEGSVPTERGAVDVRIERRPGYRLSVVVPENVRARLLIPLDGRDPQSFHVTGQRPHPGGRMVGGDLVFEDVGPGRTTVIQDRRGRKNRRARQTS